ncbi:hypothetical protein [Paraburkholderia rhizosphaerae]|uniref:Uncharacterized protein n=1 Tax=Paraburkholderia rhizosphaerae TaxID=480658 RepID=A0A4R8LHH0_9BURK|nr:hypothetical protein [Paraburkholderia rhizosphaerae]TDY42205.1 hypothetical protein BX592_12214 [Paraburkholderia rhizosphaerae]
MTTERFHLSDMRFVKRIVVGNDNPQNIRTETEVQEAMDLVNRCLSGTPRGIILGIEKSFGLYNIGEHQVVLQYVVYHIGFTRKPIFLTSPS